MLLKLSTQKMFVIAALMLNSMFLIGCETSKSQETSVLESLTDEELDQLEREIKQLPDDSVILRVLSSTP